MANLLAISLELLHRISRSVVKEDRAQDTFEYVIIIGVVVVAVIAAVVSPIGHDLVSFVIGQTSSAVSTLYSS